MSFRHSCFLSHFKFLRASFSCKVLEKVPCALICLLPSRPFSNSLAPCPLPLLIGDGPVANSLPLSHYLIGFSSPSTAIGHSYSVFPFLLFLIPWQVHSGTWWFVVISAPFSSLIPTLTCRNPSYASRASLVCDPLSLIRVAFMSEGGRLFSGTKAT